MERQRLIAMKELEEEKDKRKSGKNEQRIGRQGYDVARANLFKFYLEIDNHQRDVLRWVDENFGFPCR